MADLLDMTYINSLPQPFVVKLLGDDTFSWGVHDIDVETGLLRIDVCGLLDAKHISDVKMFRDDCGKEHHPDDFYLDQDCWVNRATTEGTAKP